MCPGRLSAALLVSLSSVIVMWSSCGDTRGPSVIFEAVELSLFGIYNTITILNIVECVPRVHHVYRTNKQNTIHMDNMMMTNDLHVPVTSAVLLFNI